MAKIKFTTLILALALMLVPFVHTEAAPSRTRWVFPGKVARGTALPIWTTLELLVRFNFRPGR